MTNSARRSYNDTGRRRIRAEICPPHEVMIMLKVAKFGGSSLSDSLHFLAVKRIVEADPARRVIVVSAAGKRHPNDRKITDLLYLCHARTQGGVPCADLCGQIRSRYLQIRDGCDHSFGIEQELSEILRSHTPETPCDHLVSRGEYLSARLMAELLGFDFIDAAEWLHFDFDGTVLEQASFDALRALADGKRIVTPGFYGILPNGEIRTFSRGGSDVTGALAAAALHADLYENWTDVPGVLAADPSIVQNPKPIGHLTYDELQQLSDVGMQVLHESAVEPVRKLNIPLQILSTVQPELPGTLVGSAFSGSGKAVGFAGRRNIGMLRAVYRRQPGFCGELRQKLSSAHIGIFHCGESSGQITLLLDVQDAALLHASVDSLRRRYESVRFFLREDLAVLAALYRGSCIPQQLIDAVQQAGIPVHYLAQSGSCLLLTVNDAQYEDAVRAAYAAT